MTPVRSYRDLVVWQKAMEFAALCYTKTRSFPRTEEFGMTAQIRRAAASIPANIAEGNGREQTGSYIPVASDFSGFAQRTGDSRAPGADG